MMAGLGRHTEQMGRPPRELLPRWMTLERKLCATRARSDKSFSSPAASRHTPRVAGVTGE